MGTAWSGMGQPPLESQAVVAPCGAMESGQWAEPPSGMGSVPELVGSVPEPSHEASQPERTKDQRRGEGRIPQAGEGSARAVCGTRQLQAGAPLAQGRALGALQPAAPFASGLQLPALPWCSGLLGPPPWTGLPRLCRQHDPRVVSSQAAAPKATPLSVPDLG